MLRSFGRQNGSTALVGRLMFHSTDATRSNRALDFYANRVLEEYASEETKRVTIRQLYVFGRGMDEEKLLRSANYVRTQVAVRLAHRIRDFQNLPFIVGMNPHLEMVYNLYWDAFERFKNYPKVTTTEENLEFCRFCQQMLQKHLVVIPQMVIGLSESMSLLKPHVVDKFLTVMLQSRISRRVIAEQHIRITEQFLQSGSKRGTDVYGIVNPQCHPAKLVSECALKAAALFRDSTLLGRQGSIPEVIVDGNVDSTLVYIDEHLTFIIFELLKNSMRHTIATYSQTVATGSSAPALPPIKVTLASNATDFALRVSDYGGGISREHVPQLWLFSPASRRKFEALQYISVAATQSNETKLFGSANAVVSASSFGRSSATGQVGVQCAKPSPPPPPGPEVAARASTDCVTSNVNLGSAFIKSQSQNELPRGAGVIDPLINLGLGLPLCRLHAEYWGGSASMYSMEGLGTDVYIRLGKLGNHLENF